MAILFKVNRRKQQLDKHEMLVRENGWINKHDKFYADNRVFYVIMSEGHLAGYYAIETNDRKSEIKWLYVLPELRGKGIGTQTLLKAIKTLYQLKVATIFCKVDFDNSMCDVAFKYGYIVGKDERLYDPNETRQVAPMVEDNKYIVVFAEKVWGETAYTMKKVLEDVCSSK